jgi:hypothetical protein
MALTRERGELSQRVFMSKLSNKDLNYSMTKRQSGFFNARGNCIVKIEHLKKPLSYPSQNLFGKLLGVLVL